ncbi:Lrp/AsnC family transcriptional regulator [Algirhabdus cladophorae]|uniref:Lrp/AsnC family transcriptional regulator n=1 Tax=Algirhabdus cladophorae TaxID=3377108 RepID=UPI003B84780E
MNPTWELDRFDLKILQILSAEGRMPVTELSKKVGLSKTPCQNRLNKLVRNGAIVGFRAVVNPTVLDRSHITFVEVKLSDTRESALKEFDQAARSVSEIEECHMIAGGFDYLLKVRSRDIKDYRYVLGSVISGLPHVANTATHVVMEPIKDQSEGVAEVEMG